MRVKDAVVLCEKAFIALSYEASLKSVVVFQRWPKGEASWRVGRAECHLRQWLLVPSRLGSRARGQLAADSCVLGPSGQQVWWAWALMQVLSCMVLSQNGVLADHTALHTSRGRMAWASAFYPEALVMHGRRLPGTRTIGN